MLRGFLFISVIFFLNLSLGGCAFSNESVQNKMGFYDAILYAIENNNDLKAMKKNLSATERNIGISKSSMMPKVVFKEDFTVTNNPIEAFAIKLNQTRATTGDLSFGTLDYPGATTNFLTAGIVQQTIFDKKALVAIKMAKTEYSANGYIYLRKQEELVNQVGQAYLNVNTARITVEALEQSLADANEYLKVAKIKYQKKSGPYADVLRAKTEVDETQQKLTSAQKNWDIAKRKLGLLLGIEDSVEASQFVPYIRLLDSDYYKEFCLYRNDIKAAEIRVENAKNNIKLAQAEWYPTLNAVASYNLYGKNYPFGADGSNYIVGAMFRWELFDGNKRRYEILKAKDTAAEAKELLNGFKKAVNFRVYEVYSHVEEQRKNLELAIATQKLAHEHIKLVFTDWKNSRSPFVDLIDARSNLEGAVMNTIKTQNDLKAALLDLNFESGIIFRELGIN